MILFSEWRLHVVRSVGPHHSCIPHWCSIWMAVNPGVWYSAVGSLSVHIPFHSIFFKTATSLRGNAIMRFANSTIMCKLLPIDSWVSWGLTRCDLAKVPGKKYSSQARRIATFTLSMFGSMFSHRVPMGFWYSPYIASWSPSMSPSCPCMWIVNSSSSPISRTLWSSSSCSRSRVGSSWPACDITSVISQSRLSVTLQWLQGTVSSLPLWPDSLAEVLICPSEVSRQQSHQRSKTWGPLSLPPRLSSDDGCHIWQLLCRLWSFKPSWSGPMYNPLAAACAATNRFWLLSRIANEIAVHWPFPTFEIFALLKWWCIPTVHLFSFLLRSPFRRIRNKRPKQ